MTERRRRPKRKRDDHLELPKDVHRPIPDPGPWRESDEWHRARG